jgi:hypothetical protein|nr:MAG TPA: hypothetical protein [Caudoviricetes sp.]
MAEETEISTPAEAAVEDTSVNEPVENTDTSSTEPETDSNAAETETENVGSGEPEKKLYAGKYESIEELEKGYSESQKFINKASEFEKKYYELLQQKEDDARKAYEARQEEARKRGFLSADEAEIADKVQIAELEYYAQNLTQVNPEYSEQARQLLTAYYNTGHIQYLNQAKCLYDPAFIEDVARAKAEYKNQLTAELNQQKNIRQSENDKRLADEIKTGFADFLTDIKENEGKARALKSFCDVGSINSKEDMQIFSNIYSQIASYEREQAIKEYEAKKAIDATKQKALIQDSSTNLDINSKPKSSDIYKMTQKQFDAYCKKYGHDWIYE